MNVGSSGPSGDPPLTRPSEKTMHETPHHLRWRNRIEGASDVLSSWFSWSGASAEGRPLSSIQRRTPDSHSCTSLKKDNVARPYGCVDIHGHCKIPVLIGGKYAAPCHFAPPVRVIVHPSLGPARTPVTALGTRMRRCKVGDPLQPWGPRGCAADGRAHAAGPRASWQVHGDLRRRDPRRLAKQAGAGGHQARSGRARRQNPDRDNVGRNGLVRGRVQASARSPPQTLPAKRRIMSGMSPNGVRYVIRINTLREYTISDGQRKLDSFFTTTGQMVDFQKGRQWVKDKDPDVFKATWPDLVITDPKLSAIANNHIARASEAVIVWLDKNPFGGSMKQAWAPIRSISSIPSRCWKASICQSGARTPTPSGSHVPRPHPSLRPSLAIYRLRAGPLGFPCLFD